jgi:transposase
MGKKATLSIDHSLEELNQIRLSQTKLPYQKKVIALIRILTNSDNTRQDLANYLGVHIRTLERWITNYRSGGIDELMSVVPRRKGSDIITSEIHEGLKSRVNNPRKGFLGYWDAKNWIEQTYGVQVNYYTVRNYLIRHFETKIKSPRKSHVNKKEGSEALFKNATI